MFSVKSNARLLTPQLNHISMKLPSVPLLSQRNSIDQNQFCNASTVTDCERDYCACTHVLRVKLNSVVEVILVDEGLPTNLLTYTSTDYQFNDHTYTFFPLLGFAYDANHPFHLHGYQFRVIAMERIGRNITVEKVKALDKRGAIRRNLDHAPLKDTVTVPDGGYTILRFYANNPGENIYRTTIFLNYYYYYYFPQLSYSFISCFLSFFQAIGCFIVTLNFTRRLECH